MDPINEYVVALLKEAKLDTVPDEFRQSLQDQLTVQAYKRIGAVIVAELGDEQATAFIELLKNPEQVDTVAVNNFLTKHTSQIEPKLRTALADMGQEFLRNLKQ